ncbi:MAG: sulfite exporter TauE/SafE family protein [Longimicrobiales bacterium]|nr:sulfite exporter TauE/SafE family protein [Longimicrobiales bacterium]
MTVWVLLSLAASGLAVGFLSGLVGIGGGVLIVPLLYFFYGHPAWGGTPLPEALHAVVAHATSLFVIVPTSVLGTWAYHRVGLVAWRAAGPIAVTSVVAALAATRVTPSIPAPALKLGFGLLLLASGARLLRAGGAVPAPDARPRLALAAVGGLAVGALSALLGVGGGIVAIPILVYLIGLPLAQVAGTSMAIIVFTALAGVAGYAAGGPDGMPAGSVGYIHMVAAVPIMAGALVAVRLGARVNQSLDTERLRLLFGVVFLVLGLRLAAGNAAAVAGML